MKKAQKQIKLDDLANGKLPKHITDSIGKLKVTVEELSLWNNTHPPFYIAFKQGYFIVDLRLRWSIKKLITIFSSFIGLFGAVAKLYLDYSPQIREWLSTIQNKF